MTYFYNREDLPEVIREEGGTYLVDGRRFCASTDNPANGFSDPNTEEQIKYEIDLRLALLHHVQDENDAATDQAELDGIMEDATDLAIRFVNYALKGLV